VRKEPPRELMPAETEKQGKSPADTHAYRLSCSSQMRVQHMKQTESQEMEETDRFKPPREKSK